ncbi:RluA family pseudouridine synthase [Fervidibacillus albus]|uniref:Pseudouridine synthase n=1 Tax=Fervidibacillus albus TaxID=2980026 RepID=A0A9E8LSL8_9BACI|nr:RluA family pseudouridine synthase [Fervidibacillus albus]WAA08645.1 RluA family pseudouridine synthase [Fervidibacillus albus]
MNQLVLKWTIQGKDREKTVKQFLQEQKLSRQSLTEIKYRGGALLIDEREVTVRHRLEEGERLKVVFPKEEKSVNFIPEPLPFSIVYEDAYLLVVNKPPFLNTIPSPIEPSGSLANGVLHYFENIGLFSTPHIVTRLDKNTSGLVLVAKFRHVHHLLNSSTHPTFLKKEYEAFVEGKIDPKMGLIDAPIGRKEGSIIERIVSEDGQSARTRYRLIRQYDQFAHLRLQLDTGRTHQIRVHMAHIGHPLLGDDLYGGNRDMMNRQALHCKQLTFIHPMKKRLLQVTADLPKDMVQLIQQNRLDER